MKHAIHSTPDRSNPDNIRQMFNAIAPTYDVLNHLMSFGLDIRWRRKAVRLLEEKHRGVFLDIAAGSGDVSFDLMELHPQHVVAADFAHNMLTVLQQKLSQRVQSCTIDVVSCDALSLPFQDGVFDGTIVAFGMRNFADRLQSLKEMLRVLKPGGISVILELTKPQAPPFAQLYTVYSRVGLPIMGKIISRHNSAYRYLPESIAQFPARNEFCALMETAGFSETNAMSLTFGAATIFIGRKSAAGPILVETSTMSSK
jgi:demethylmenaquinone methyltransferase/2-methoxy-6-polyprenyl-1,4-benzoquinol methylase